MWVPFQVGADLENLPSVIRAADLTPNAVRDQCQRDQVCEEGTTIC
jgi:hypothetical protein